MSHIASIQYEFYYNIDIFDMDGPWQRSLMLWSESAQVVKTHYNQFIYVGGNMGSDYKNKIGHFTLDACGPVMTRMKIDRAEKC